MRTLKTITTMTIMLLLLFNTITIGETLNVSKPLVVKNSDKIDLNTNTYYNFLKSNNKVIQPVSKYSLKAAESSLENGEMINEFESKKNIALIRGEGSIEWNCSIKDSGLYDMMISYNSLLGLNSEYQFSLYIDDAIQYDIASRIILKKGWRDSRLSNDGEFLAKNGNDLKPAQEEIKMWQDVLIYDIDGYNDAPLKVLLTAGTHKIKLVFNKSDIAIEQFSFLNTQPELKKEAVINLWEKNGYKKITNEDDSDIYINAEHTYMKSDSSIMPVSDRSSAATQPNNPYNIKLNTIGGRNFGDNGQWISWKFNVKTAGIYRIDMRVRQDLVRGIDSARKIYIDDKIQYESFSEIRFPYDTNWYIKTIGDKDVCPVYLSKGDHVIKMQVTSPYSDIVNQINSFILDANNLYRKIIMITGHTPDQYNDYKLDIAVPDLMSSLKSYENILNDIHSKMLLAGFKKGGEIVLVEQFLTIIKSFIEKPETIPNRLDPYKSGISSCAALIDILTFQPLEIDSISLLPINSPRGKNELSFLESFIFAFKQYLATYSDDYNSFTDVTEKKALQVWVSSGRDQTQIIKNLVEDDFSSKKNIPVSVNLVQQALIQATLTGRGPDVAIFVSSIDTINLAIRNALVDISKYKDFEDSIKQYHPTSTDLYRYNGSCYAMPLVESFSMMFYRKDILNELGVEIPKTWEDFNKALITLQRKNLSVGIPSLIDSAGAGSGLSWQNAATGQNIFFETIMFQNNSNFYKNNWYTSGLDTVKSLQAFKQMTDYFIKYSLPTEYNFYTRFRSGEMPLAIQSYQVYNQLKIAAPEIRGLWGMAEIPGVKQTDGTINNTVAGVGTSVVMFKKTKNQEDGWEFMKWLTSADTQGKYGRQVEMILGAGARYEPANVEAFKSLPWTDEEKTNLMSQWDKMQMMQMTPVSYYINRNITNAFRKVVYQRQNYRETLNYYNKEIIREMNRKKQQFVN